MDRMLRGEGSIQDYGYDLHTIAKLAKLGMVFSGIGRHDADGTSTSSPYFRFIKGTPMGRINVAAGTEDLDLLDTAMDDAYELTYEEFSSKYPSFGPYDT